MLLLPEAVVHPAALVLPQLPVTAFRSEGTTIIYILKTINFRSVTSEEGDLEDIANSL